MPLEFGEGKNVKWKTPMPGKAWSSPVIWGKQIWFTNAEAYHLTSRVEKANEVDNPAAGEAPLFSHMYVKSMEAEQLYDSLIVATSAHKAGGAGWEESERQRQRWLQQFVIAFGTDENDETTTFNGTIPQALMMMNGRFVRTQSIYLAEQIQREAGRDLAPQVKQAWQHLYSRTAGERELEEAVALLTQLVEYFEELLADKEKAGDSSGDLAEPVTSSDPQVEALASLCQALLSSSEFLYVD